MNEPNPYQSPQYQQAPYAQPPYAAVPPRPMNRTPFILGGIGALATSAYWGLLTLFIGVAAASGGASAFQLVFPVILIVLYAMRGIQLFKGDPTAARRLLWLHGVGAVVGLIQLTSPDTIVVVLYAVKVGLHVFGGVMAYLALRAYNQFQRGGY